MHRTTTTRRRPRRLAGAIALGVAVAVAAGAATVVGTGALDTALGVPPGPAVAPPAAAETVGPATGVDAAAVDPPSPDGALDAELVRRFEEARAAAAEDGVELTITSGRRTAQEQQALVDETLARYGTEEEAHRWVAPPDGSAHVTGTAIDVGPTAGAYWLQQHGWRFGLCQVFDNEVWHYEATVEQGGTCGPTVPDASGLWR